MSSEDISVSPTAEAAAPGITSANRPLGEPQTDSSLDVSATKEFPEVPSRPSRRTTEITNDLEVNSEKQLEELENMNGKQVFNGEKTAVDEPYVPERPVRKAEPHIIRKTASKDSQEDLDFVSEIPTRPERPIRTQSHEEVESCVEPVVPARPSRKETEPIVPIRPAGHGYHKNAEPVNNDTEMVEPLIPKRPVRRTTDETSTPVVPHRPRKAATSIEFTAIKKNAPVQLEDDLSRTLADKNILKEGFEPETEEFHDNDDESLAEITDITSGISTELYTQTENREEINDREKNETKETEQIINSVEKMEDPVQEISGTKNIETIEADILSEPVLSEKPHTDIYPSHIDEDVGKEREEKNKDIESPTPSISIEKDVSPEDSIRAEKEIEIPEEARKEETEKEQKTTPVIPSRPTKKGPPPVPKKPSSKIAAFHEMLQRQQMKNLGVEEGEGESDVRTTKESPTTSSIPTPIEKDSTTSRTSNIANNLNGLFALPGMVPGGALPPSLSKKLGINTPTEEIVSNNNSKKGLSDVRQKRARGPRGRKLPSNVSNIKKVVDNSTSNDIEMFTTWTIVVKPETKELAVDEEEKKDSSESEENAEPINKATDEVLPGTEAEKTEIVESLETTPLSVGEAIEAKDQDETLIYMEQKLEDMAENLMEQEMLKTDKETLYTEDKDSELMDDPEAVDEDDN